MVGTRIFHQMIPNRDGFTLIELMIVVTVMAIIAVVALPTITSYFQVTIDSACREMSSIVKEVYNSTMITGKVHRLVFDIQKNEYWVEVGPATYLLDTKESLEKEKSRSLFRNLVDKTPASSFKLDDSITKKKISLPVGVKFDEIITQQSVDPLREGKAYTHFFPHGITERTIVILSDSSDHKASLVVTALIGRTDLYDHAITPAEIAAEAR